MQSNRFDLNAPGTNRFQDLFREVEPGCRRCYGSGVPPEHCLIADIISRCGLALHVGGNRKLSIPVQQEIRRLELDDMKVRAQALLKGARELAACENGPITRPNSSSWFA